jgi:aldose 1-epimerase
VQPLPAAGSQEGLELVSADSILEPTPRLVVISSDSIQAELLPNLGARLHRLTVFGHDLLRTPADPRLHLVEPFAWGGYVMAPWCNRVDPVPTVVGGSTVNLRSNAPDGSALHGQVYLVSWQERAPGAFEVRGGGDGTGWPWPYETTLDVTATDLGPGRAEVTFGQVLTNLGEQPMPGGIGFHPWFRAPIEVCIASARVLPSNLRFDDPIEAVSGAFDLRSLGSMPSGLDATWLDPGDPPVRLRWPDLGISATMEAVSDTGLCIVAASPAEGGAVAVEPETHAPQGIRRLLAGHPYGLAWIGPGQAIRLTTRIVFESSA